MIKLRFSLLMALLVVAVSVLADNALRQSADGPEKNVSQG